ncbi:response regulator [Mucilaginibacter terrae]|uniref:CheY-like chemotaxis protein n=1 Tax=Mucilaginibacter terrae TaxID=1955052 RepID=A0ABU3H0L4_9SPHI|nr:response regulator [Mucilaginibacter terrae]MDT3405554.1 CheY-like chemotaxis protein [Mucilaginibacter terrae]
MSKRILIIDNDPDTPEVMKEALSYEGFTVHTELFTDNIMALIKLHNPDIVLLDYILNGINGGELCSLVKKDSNTAHIPMVILSAYSSVINSLGYFGCNAFVAISFDLNNLVGKN